MGATATPDGTPDVPHGGDRRALEDAARRGAQRVGALIAGLDENHAHRPAPGLDWTVRDACAHVVNLLDRVLADQRRSSTPADTAALNATCIEELGPVSLRDLAERVRQRAPVVFDEVLPRVGDDLEFPFHAGVTTTIPQALGVLTMEFLVHGDDIARAAGKPWAIEPHDAAIGLTAAAPLMRGWLTPTARTGMQTFGFDLGAPGTRTFRIAPGEVTVSSTREAYASSPARTTVGADALLLAVFRRRASDDPVVRSFVACFEDF